MNLSEESQVAASGFGPGADTAAASRTGAVEMNEVSLIRSPELVASDDFRRMNERLRASEAIVESLERTGPVRRDALLTETLDRLVADGQVEGLLIGSDEGFVVARSTRSEQADLLAVIGTVFEFVAHRIQAERLIDTVEEMVARGAQGEQVVMRYFPGTRNRFFLVAHSRQAATYRRTMARALKLCGPILAGADGATP